MHNNEYWWKGAVIYQIYPRSFMDSNNDGIGDLNGITEKLSHIASLGVDAIWISPFFTSPMHDFGYDIADYVSVDPIFGDVDDFKRLMNKAHSLNIKVIIDQVISHSSDQHEWFIESSSSKNNAKADWYVWADANENGEPPNNWLAFFGGSAWQWNETRKQYYLHNFLTSQPDINFHCKEARQAQLDNVKFWLDMGVDGVRLDVVNFYYHSKGLEDNPETSKVLDNKVGVTTHNPYAQQEHIYDITQPENILFLQELRALMDQYPGRTSIGEINAEDDLKVMAEYTANQDKLHMAYTFDLLGNDSSAEYIHSVIERFESMVADGWPCWAMGNHDVERIASRWNNEHHTNEFPKLAAALLLSLKGSVCLYQGDELGLPEANVPYDDIVDPYGKPFWPDYKGRDGCRTPMVWNNSKYGGFSHAKPWLPVDNEHLCLSVAEQENDKNSTLAFFREFILWRKQYDELINGDIELLAPKKNIIAWIRKSKDRRILAVFNLGSIQQNYKIEHDIISPLNAPSFQYELKHKIITLPRYSAFYAEIAMS